MSINLKKLTIVTATVFALGAPAFADGHGLDVNTARLDATLDTNGDGEVSDDEIIDANIAMFDLDGDGALNAFERGEAEAMVSAEQ